MLGKEHALQPNGCLDLPLAKRKAWAMFYTFVTKCTFFFHFFLAIHSSSKVLVLVPTKVAICPQPLNTSLYSVKALHPKHHVIYAYHSVAAQRKRSVLFCLPGSRNLTVNLVCCSSGISPLKPENTYRAAQTGLAESPSQVSE